MPSESVVALIAAAGRASRFGRDKRQAVLSDGEPLLHRVLAQAQRHFGHTVVILGAHDDPASLGLAATQSVVYAPADGIGLGSSLGAGFQHLRTLDERTVAAAVLLADMPWIDNETFARLLPLATRRAILRPTFDGVAGHPVVFGRRFWPELSELKGDEGAKSVFRKHREHYQPLPVQDSGVLADIDRPGDLVAGANREESAL